MEQERTRRLSSIDHAERMLERKVTMNSADLDEVHDATNDLSEIAVAHPSAAKIMVDELNEWRCLISSESPDEEKDKLRGPYEMQHISSSNAHLTIASFVQHCVKALKMI